MILSGAIRLGRDCELRYAASGTAVINLAGVYNYGRKGNDGKKSSQWIEAVLFGAQAEALSQYLTKGTQVDVALKDVHIDYFKKQDGTETSKLVGTIINIDFVGSVQKPVAPKLQPVRPVSDDADIDIPF